MARLTIFLFSIFLLFTVAQASDQSSAVEAYLQCETKKSVATLVELWDHDTLDPDDLMGKTNSNAKGWFHVEGYTEEITQITPYIKIHHNCTADKKTICSKIYVPKEFITKAKKPVKTWRSDVIKLAFLKNDGC